MLPFAITQINLEGVMISEIHQRKTNTVCYYLCGLKKIQLINITKKNPDSQIQKTKQWLPVVRGKWGEAIQEQGIKGYKLKCKIDCQDILYSMGNISELKHKAVKLNNQSSKKKLEEKKNEDS